MQTEDFVNGERILACLDGGPAPPLQPAARRTLTFDFKACAAIGEEHETGSPRDKVRARAPHDFNCFSAQVALEKSFQRFGLPDCGAELCGAKKIVADTMAF